MPHADFIHLRVHSAYSLSEGAIKNKQLVDLCKRNSMPAVAVTDTGNLFGAMEFTGLAKDAGVQPITGCQLGIARKNRIASGADGRGNVLRRAERVPLLGREAAVDRVAVEDREQFLLAGAILAEPEPKLRICLPGKSRH